MSDFEFARDPEGGLSLKSAIFQALGAASTCWSGGPQGIFDTRRARTIGDTLHEFIRTEIRGPATDPRTVGGDIAGSGGPHDRHGVVIDPQHAVLLEFCQVAMVEPYRDDIAGPPVIAMRLDGRINKTSARARILFMFDEDGAAAIITELLGLAGRAGLGPKMVAAIEQRLQALAADDNLHPRQAG